MLLPFVLSSVYWALEFAEQLERIQAYMLGSAKRQDRNLTAYDTLFNAIILVNVCAFPLFSTRIFMLSSIWFRTE